MEYLPKQRGEIFPTWGFAGMKEIPQRDPNLALVGQEDNPVQVPPEVSPKGWEIPT